MRGKIHSYDQITTSGVIIGDDGQSYVFTLEDIHTGNEIRETLVVDFVGDGPNARQIVVFTAAEPLGNTFASLTSALPPSDAYDFKSAMLSFQGRLRRKYFWLSLLILFGANLIAGFIPFIGPLLGLILIWPGVAVIVKRLHDMGRTGWYAFVPYVGNAIAIVVAFLGGGAAMMSAAANGNEISTAAAGGAVGAFALAAIISLVSNLGFLIWIGATDSQPGTNDYGPNPKGL